MSSHINSYISSIQQMLDELTEVQQEILMNYLGICIEIHLKMLEEVAK